MSEKESRGCLKTGLLGCLGVFGLGVVVMLGLGGLAFLDSQRAVEQVTEETSRAVPGFERRTATAEQLADAETVETVPTSLELPVETTQGAGGTLELDLQMGEFSIVPSDGDEIEVVADYDQGRFALEEELVEDGDGRWRYRVSFGNKGRLRLFGGRVDNRVEIRVPRGLRFALVGEVGMGQSELELGGLSPQLVDLELRMGDHRVSFAEPTAEPMESFDLEASMGSVRVADLGNGSPRSISAQHRMGELRMGLEGQWLTDSDVRVRCSMGECGVRVPDDVNIDSRARVVMGDKSERLPDATEVPAGAPTLRLDLSGAMGEVSVR